MIKQLAKRLKLSDQEIATIKKEQADVKFNKTILISMVIVAIISITIFSLLQDSMVLFTMATIIVFLLIIGIYLYYKEQKEFSLAVKNIIIKGLFEEEFSNVIYNPKKGFDENFIRSTNMYEAGNRFDSQDLLAANYKNVGFMQADVKIEQVTSNGKTTTTTTLFEGRWLVCDFIKDFKGYHQVRSNNFFKNKKPFKWFNDQAKIFELEDNSFNKKFTCYTTNQPEAFYLINPAYMQRLSDFVDYVNSEVVFGFINNKLHVAIFNRKDAFEINGTKINDAFVNNIEEDIKLIKLVIDYLDLDLDIFK